MIGNGQDLKGKGYKAVNKYGANLNIGTGTIPETIWSHGGQFPFLDVGIPVDIISSSTNDTLLGTGARQIKITYFLTDNSEITEIIDMNGTTPVPLSDDFKISTRIKLESTGNLNTNDGEINIVDRATGLVVYQSVEIGEGQTLSAVQICPKGKKGLIKKHKVNFAKNQSPAGSADMRFNIRDANGTITTKHVTVISTTKPEDEYIYNIGGIEMSEGDIAYWQCLSVSANNTPILGRFDVEFTDL